MPLVRRPSTPGSALVEGLRFFRVDFRLPVTFSENYIDPPVVNLSMTMWDSDHQTNQRVDIQPEEITETGFTIVFRTWGDTRIARVRASWLAIGEIRDEDDWDLY